ncbi:MAG: alkaline phosphatase D family protein [Solirubrobacterales bacterium]|nr:alkaline phosphatase D family protein [Solirubrobacterales bacterium]
MAELILGPLLRYVGEREATVWVETDAPCQVEVLGHRARTFHVAGHHYGLVAIDGLEPGRSREYGVVLDGERRWPEPRSALPPSRVRTLHPHDELSIAFGSCRVAAPQSPPYNLERQEHRLGLGVDALLALARRVSQQPEAQRPSLLLMVGDQVYADHVSPATREFMASRRSLDEPPGEEIADFEEYTRLYREAWREPLIRWLLSTVPSAMIFDDHEVIDDWNISAAWKARVRRHPWWRARIAGAFMAYWLYQHLGNLSPEQLRQDELLQRARAADDAAPMLEEFALHADRTTAGKRWSFSRELGRSRLVVIDSRAGRVLSDGRREMLDEEEWRWLQDELRGVTDHLLLATSLPFLLPTSIHDIERWNEAVCAGAWGSTASKLGERLRYAIDLEHWASFGSSFDRLAGQLREIGAGGNEAGRCRSSCSPGMSTSPIWPRPCCRGRLPRPASGRSCVRRFAIRSTPRFVWRTTLPSAGLWRAPLGCSRARRVCPRPRLSGAWCRVRTSTIRSPRSSCAADALISGSSDQRRTSSGSSLSCRRASADSGG